MRICSILASAGLCTIFAAAQNSTSLGNSTDSSASATKAEAAIIDEHKKVLALWHERADALTNAMLQDDEWRISVERPVLMARLAYAWWKVDPSRAHAWLADAVESVTHEFPSDKPEVRNLRLRAAESVFRICEYLKQDEQARRIVLALLDLAKKNGHDPARHHSPEISGLAGSIMAAGTEIAREDPARAADMANLLIQFHSEYLNNLLGSIAAKDPQDAERLYSNALDTALDSRDYTMMYSLMQYAFPYYSGARPVPDTLKSLTIEKAGALLSLPLNSEDDRQQFCMGAGGIASHLANNLPPSQLGVVQASLQSCPEKAEEDQHGDDPDACDSADACLKLAETAKTDEARASLKIDAAEKARNEDPVRALSILDSLTPEEREWQPAWPNDYWMIGMEAMKHLFELHDSHNIQRVIDDAPSTLRAQMALNLLDWPDVRKDKPYAISVLMEVAAIAREIPYRQRGDLSSDMQFLSRTGSRRSAAGVRVCRPATQPDPLPGTG